TPTPATTTAAFATTFGIPVLPLALGRTGGLTAGIRTGRAGVLVGQFLGDFVAGFSFQYRGNSWRVVLALGVNRAAVAGGRLVAHLLLAFLGCLFAALDRRAIFVHFLAVHLGFGCRNWSLVAALTGAMFSA